MSPSILIAAGGTGGHLFPAEALASELAKYNCLIHLATDERGKRVAAGHEQWQRHAIASGGIAGKNPAERLKNILCLALGFLQSLVLVIRIKPKVAIGFGGYPSLAPLLAARLRGAKIIIHEQNALAGRANRFLKPYAHIMAAGFPKTSGLGEKIVVTGNPARLGILALTQRVYEEPKDEIHLLITGGSQGARSFSDLIPHALALLPHALQKRLKVSQQVRHEDIARVQDFYRAVPLEVELKPFFNDMPARLADAHLAITRAGASTLTELAIAGTPAILIPLPNSIDGHQEANAKIFQEIGAAAVLSESGLRPKDLALAIEEQLSGKEKLHLASQAMRRLAKPDAAMELAKLVIDIIRQEQEENGHARLAS